MNIQFKENKSKGHKVSFWQIQISDKVRIIKYILTFSGLIENHTQYVICELDMI